jgi:hypothetical protein
LGEHAGGQNEQGPLADRDDVADEPTARQQVVEFLQALLEGCGLSL